MSDLEPLSDLARELLDEERGAVTTPPELSGRVMAKLEAALGPSLGFGADGAGGGSGGSGGSEGGAGHGGAPPAAAGAGAALGGAKLAAVLATTFAVGTGAGVAIDRTAAAPPATVTVYLPAPSPPSAAVTATAVPSASASAAPTIAPRPTATTTAAGTTDAKSDLARERELIDAARAGVARGHADAALSAVNRHEREFPQGQLREEREGLRILALAAQGRSAEARTFAARFRKSYPQSVLMPQIDAALGGP